MLRLKAHWTTRKWIRNKPGFWFQDRFHRGVKAVDETRTLYRLLLPTLPELLRTVLFASFVIVVFEAPGYFFPLTPNYIKDVIEKNANAVDAFLTATASIAGVFLGLYFAAISSIASSLLVRATQNIRSFFLFSPQGQQYVRTVAMTGIISVFYLVTRALGHNIHPVGILGIAILTAYIVIRFWRVGAEVFTSLEPSDSFRWTSKRVVDSVTSVVFSKLQGRMPALQNHHRKLATQQLKLMSDLIDFGIEETHLPDDQLHAGLSYLSGLLMFYPDYKNKTPGDSYWYPKKLKHELWAFSDTTKITLALNTGTTIPPTPVKDPVWFEAEILSTTEQVFEKFTNPIKVVSVYKATEIFVEVAEKYGDDLDVDACRMLLQRIIKACKPTTIFVALDPETRKEKIALVDAQGRLAIASLLGLSKKVSSQTCGDIQKIISQIDWGRDRSTIYKVKLPSNMLEGLETIFNEVRNEIIIEGRRLSPDWYLQTLVTRRYVSALKNYFEFIKSLHKDFFQAQIKLLLENKSIPEAAQLAQRWGEFCNKYSFLVQLMKTRMEECSNSQGVKDLPWPTFDPNGESAFADEMGSSAADCLVEMLLHLHSDSPNEDLPDYFGQALTKGLEACHDAARGNDAARLKRLLPKVFLATLKLHDIAREKSKDWSEVDSKIIFTTEPLVNLIELCGLIKLYSELSQNPKLWSVTEDVWNKYLEAGNGKEHIQYLATICAYRDSQFKIMPQATLRLDWQRKFEEEMRKRGLKVFPDVDVYETRLRKPTHPSPLIRVMERYGGMMSMIKGQTVFFATYLSKHPLAKGIEFPDKRDLAEDIEDEIIENKA